MTVPTVGVSVTADVSIDDHGQYMKTFGPTTLVILSPFPIMFKSMVPQNQMHHAEDATACAMHLQWGVECNQLTFRCLDAVNIHKFIKNGV
jgi:hypothetical protein